MKIYFALPDLLKELGWTQKKLADKTGLSQNTISNLCNNPRAIRLDSLGKICEATGLSPERFFVI